MELQQLKFVNEKEFNTLILGKLPVFAEFWTPECLACEMANPFLIELTSGYAGKIEVVKINTQRCVELAKKYIITCWPTFIMFKSAKIMFQSQGFRNGIDLEKKIRFNLN